MHLTLPILAARSRLLALTVVVALLVVHVPSAPAALADSRQARATARQIDKAIVEPLRGVISPGERIILAPAGNDFVANHLAAQLGVLAYNVGGDRHNVAARATWPPEVGAVSAVARPGFERRAARDAASIVTALRGGDVDVIVLPYVNLGFYEPCEDPAAADSPCRARYRAVTAVIDALQSDPELARAVAVERLEQASVIRLASSALPQAEAGGPSSVP